MRLLLLLLSVLFVPTAAAQISIGGQLGEPTGLALKIGDGQGAILVAVGWDLGDDDVSVEAHYLLRSRGLRGNRNVRLFYGPGLFGSFGEDRKDRFGLSLGVGLETEIVQDIELYGLISPRLQLIDQTDFDLGGGVGVRLQL